MLNIKKFWNGLRIVAKTVLSSDTKGELEVLDSDGKLNYHNGSTRSPVVTESHTSTFTNKTFDADGTGNSLLNIEDANIKSGAAIDAAKIADGSVSSTEFQYLDGVTSSIQTQLNDKASASGLSDHISDPTGAHAASAISVTPVGALVATDAQAAFAELDSDIDLVGSDLAAHILDSTDAHDASAISNTPSGNLAATDIQGAVNELQSDIDTRATTSALSAHTGASAGVHGVTGDVVGTTDTQTLSAKTLTAPLINNGSATGTSIITPARSDVKRDTKANLDTYADTATDGQLVFATDQEKYYGIIDNDLKSLGGGSQGLDTFVQLYADEQVTDWSTGNNVTFLGGGTVAGTFARVISGQLNGDASYRFTQAAGSLNDYIASPIQSVPLRFRGQTNSATMFYTYNGNNSDLEFIVWDVTNSVRLTETVSNLLPNANGTIWKVNVVVPPSCTQLRVGIQVKTLSSGSILNFDDIEVSSDTLRYTTTGAGVVGEVISYAGASVPPNFLSCDGSAVSRAQYADLFSAIGTRYGTGDGSTTFNIPDLRGVFLRGNIDINTVTGSGSAASNNATFTAHGLIRTGFKVRLSSGALTGLTTNTTYYAIVVDANTLAFATTYANAIAGTKIVISGVNTAVIIQMESPDSATRLQSAVGGATSGVATREEDALQGHYHASGAGSNSAANAPYTAFATFGTVRTELVRQAITDGTNGTPRTARESRSSNVAVNYCIRFSATTPNTIVTAPETFSTDTASLTYASSAAYTLATLNTAPVGTFITFTYAASTNTRTQTTTAPTQTTADMNVNGIRLFTRTFNAASTAASPACIAIQIGKGLKGKTLDVYKSTGRTTAGNLDYTVVGTSTQVGALFKDYNDLTGVLLIDLGTTYFSTTTTSYLAFSDNTFLFEGYLVINASKSPALTGVPLLIPRIATISDVKASGTEGGTATSGSYQTRTLNTLSDPTGIVTSLTSNQFVLPTGEYYIESSAPAVQCGRHKAKLRNITDSVDSLIGTSEFSEDTTTDRAVTRSLVLGTITISSPKTFELQHRVETSIATTGYGAASSFGDNEVYSIVKITKVK